MKGPVFQSGMYHRSTVQAKNNLYYIFVRGGCTEAGEAAGATCGVPLGPG